MNKIVIKRAYEPVSVDDGWRVLVDRLWPRGISKEGASVNLWLKDLAPSTGLRRWFGHNINRWDTFRKEYERELLDNPTVPPFLEEVRSRRKVSLIYGAKDKLHNHAVVLKDFLEDNLEVAS